ncbi:MAG: hypothetical protein JO212_02275 [Acetobacteraceae bacterium]|nr:hypothetical protein [Acetobacteraceae bacterium]
MRKTLKVGPLAAVFTFGSLALSPLAHAQLPPPDPIFDLAQVHSGPLSSYQFFTTSFTANTTNETVSFAFREVPKFFAFDDVSVTARGSNLNLLADPGFESAVVGTNVPAGWTRFIQPVDVTAIGVVASATQPGGCPPNGPHSGSQFWCDGSVEGYDGLSQTLPTVVGQTYDVGFWLADNSGQPVANPTIDALVYATNGLPQGTEPFNAVEPRSVALLGFGLLGLGFVSWYRRPESDDS